MNQITLIQHILQSSPNAAISTATLQWNYEQLNQQVQNQSSVFLNMGLTEQDVLLIPAHKKVGDLINVLAALQCGAAVLLTNPSLAQLSLNSVKPVASVIVLNTNETKLERIQEPFLDKKDINLRAAIGICSSGSTGTPKLIWHSIAAIIDHAKAANDCLPLHKGARSLVSLPLYHVGGLGLLFRALVSNTELVFDLTADDLTTYKRDKITRASLVPTQLHRLLSQQIQESFQPDTQILLGGAPISDQLLTTARNQGWKIHRSYGLSEMASQVMTETRNNYWQILNNTAFELGDDSEIHVQGAGLFLGYGHPNNPQRILKDGWFATRDLARWQKNKFKFIGRKDNMFVSGGENIQPESIEQRLLNCPGLEKIVITPIASSEWGQLTTAFIWPDTIEVKTSVEAYAQLNLLPHERPRYYYRWQANEQLKIQRQQFINKVATNDVEEIN